MSIGGGPSLDPTTRTGDGGRTSAARIVARHFVAWTFGLGRNVWLLPLDVAFRSVGIRYGWLKWLFETVPPPVLAITGRLRAERATWRAIRRVPAYRDYLERNRIDPDGLPPAAILRAVPETDKASYIDPLPDRPALCRGPDRVQGRHDRRVEWLHGDAVQLDPRGRRTKRRPSQHRVLRALRVRRRRPGHAQRVLDGRLGDRLQHVARDEPPWAREVDRAGHPEDPLLARGPRPVASLPDQRLSAVHQAPARRGRPSGLSVGVVPDVRARRRGRDGGGAPRPAPRAVRGRLLRLRRDRPRDRHGRRVPGQRRPPAPGPGTARHPGGIVRGRPAAADGLPVQPPRALPRGQLARGGAVHRQPARSHGSPHPLQRP